MRKSKVFKTTVIIILVSLLVSGCKKSNEEIKEPIIEGPKLWHVLKPLSEEEKLIQRSYFTTNIGDKFPIDDIKDGFVIINSGSSFLQNEMIMDELMQLSDLNHITILNTGHGSIIKGKPYYETLELPQNSELYIDRLDDILKTGLKEEHLRAGLTLYPTIWLLEGGIIKKQFDYYYLGNFEALKKYLTDPAEEIVPFELNAKLPKFNLINYKNQALETVEISKPSLLVYWSMNNPIEMLSEIIEAFSEQIDIILVLQAMHLRVINPQLIEALTTRPDAEERIEWLHFTYRKNHNTREKEYANEIYARYPNLLIYEDWYSEMCRMTNIYVSLHPFVITDEDPHDILSSFFLVNNTGVLVEEWFCRMTTGYEHEKQSMINMLKEAIQLYVE